MIYGAITDGSYLQTICDNAVSQMVFKDPSLITTTQTVPKESSMMRRLCSEGTICDEASSIGGTVCDEASSIGGTICDEASSIACFVVVITYFINTILIFTSRKISVSIYNYFIVFEDKLQSSKIN